MAIGAARKGEPGKTRPAVVVSSNRLDQQWDSELLVVVPISASREQTPLRPLVPASCGIDRDSVAVVTGVQSGAASRLVRRIGIAPPSVMREIDEALRFVLELG